MKITTSLNLMKLIMKTKKIKKPRQKESFNSHNRSRS